MILHHFVRQANLTGLALADDGVDVLLMQEDFLPRSTEVLAGCACLAALEAQSLQQVVRVGIVAVVLDGGCAEFLHFFIYC